MSRPRPSTVRAALGALLLVGLSGFAGPVRADPFSLYGLGSRAPGMAGTHTAVAEGFEASYYNPAGIIRSRGVRFGGGYAHSFSGLEANGQALELRETVHSGWVGGISYGTELAGYPAGFSIGYAVPDVGTIRAVSLTQLQPQFVMVTNRTQRAEVVATAGAEVLPGVSIGAGVAIGADLGGDVLISSTLAPPDATGNLDLSVKNRIQPVVGFLLTPLENLRFGLSYRGEATYTLGITALASIQISEDVPEGVVLGLPVGQVFHYWPHVVTAGVAWDPAADWTLAADLEWADWSDLESLYLEGALVTEGLLTDLDLLRLPEFGQVVAPGFHDTYSPRVGVEHRLPEGPWGLRALRLGYAFRPSPAPEASGTQNLLDSDQHTVAAGVGFAFRDPWGILLRDATLDLHAQWHHFTRREIVKENPSDPVGDLVIEGDRFVVGGMLTLHFGGEEP